MEEIDLITTDRPVVKVEFIPDPISKSCDIEEKAAKNDAKKIEMKSPPNDVGNGSETNKVLKEETAPAEIIPAPISESCEKEEKAAKNDGKELEMKSPPSDAYDGTETTQATIYINPKEYSSTNNISAQPIVFKSISTKENGPSPNDAAVTQIRKQPPPTSTRTSTNKTLNVTDKSDIDDKLEIAIRSRSTQKRSRRGRDGLVSHDTKWHEMFGELNKFKENEGHCNVPARYEGNKKLGKWIATQRTQYKHMQEGKKTHMTDQRIQALLAVGFTWTVGNIGRPDEKNWRKRYGELCEFKATQGHCRVPQKYPDNVQLGRWVDKQRTNYRYRKEGKKSQMTDERLKLLQEIGFFNGSKQNPPTSYFTHSHMHPFATSSVAVASAVANVPMQGGVMGSIPMMPHPSNLPPNQIMSVGFNIPSIMSIGQNGSLNIGQHGALNIGQHRNPNIDQQHTPV